jgi:ferredoxin
VHTQGEDIKVVAEEGKTLLEVAHENDIELEGEIEMDAHTHQ